MFAGMLVVAFIKGGIDAGRAEMLTQLLSHKLVMMTLRQLGEITVTNI
jgi:hypothetical protein